MFGLVLMVAASTLPAKGAADAALAEYMRALAPAQQRWALVAELAANGRTDEARSLGTQRLSAILEEDFGAAQALLAAPPRWTSDPPWHLISAAAWLADRGQPALAAQFYERAATAGAALRDEYRLAWYRACIEVADPACMARASPEVPGVLASTRSQLQSLATGKLAIPDALRLRAQNVYGRPSVAIALDAWAARLRTPREQIDRLHLLARVLGPEGRRLAYEAVVAHPDTPATEAMRTLRLLAESTTDRERAFSYWRAMASDRRTTECDQANALLEMGLIRQGQGRPAEALDLFRKVLPLNSDAVSSAALQIGHTLFRQGDHEAALAAYRQAESEYWWGRAWRPQPQWRFALYQGMSLDHLGRRDEAIAEYAFALLAAPLSWRRPLAVHLIDMYDAAGQLDALRQFADGLPAYQYAVTLPLRRLMIVHGLEKERDWPSLVHHLKGEPERAAWTSDGRGRSYLNRQIARVLARHCSEVLPLLAGSSSDRASVWVGHALALCGQADDPLLRLPSADQHDDRDLPELAFPPVTPGAVAAPIVAAVHARPRPTSRLPPPCR